MSNKKSLLVLAVSALVVTPAVYAETTLAEAIKAGEAHLNFRLRYENVDQSNAAKLEADALTLRSRINYKTADFQGFTAFVEVDNVSALDKNDYNSTTNGQGHKSVIADPTGTEVNQVWLGYSNWNTQFTYGRQRINLDNQRFIGGVGFRQNEQTYDGFSITNKSLEDTTVFYAKINNVNRIFGEDHPGGDHESDTDLLNIKYSGFSAGTLSAYAYLIDNEDFSRFSTDTYGVRFAGSTDVSELKFAYTLEYARQKDSNNNTVDYKADYLLAEAGVTLSGVNVKLGYEVLASDGGSAAFVTPLATLHKFQGWTDQFLATPNEGIADAYLSVGGKISGVKLMVVYHDFSADENNIAADDDLGSEFGLLIARGFGNYGLSLKYADYSAGDSTFGKSDTQKLWLTATAKF